MTNGHIYMSESGLAKTKEALERKLVEYDELCRERTLAYAQSGDGWHDNPHFNRMQQLEADKTREIAALKVIVESAKVLMIEPNKRPTARVAIGSIVKLFVTYESSNESKELIWEITGYNETDVSRWQLAYNTPMASSLLGAEVGEEIEVRLPGGMAFITVLELISASVI